MTKYERYQDYVIANGKLVGEFEQMYKDFDDPWEQSTYEQFASEKAICVNLIESLACQNVIEFGCGFGHLTNRIKSVCPKVVGLEISPTAVVKASKRYPECEFVVSEFPDFETLRHIRPDCIVMAEITWYVLEQLDEFIAFMKAEMPDTYLIHLLTTYRPGVQKYGADKFCNLSEILKYFRMNYLESGEIETAHMDGGKRTYFIGRYS